MTTFTRERDVEQYLVRKVTAAGGLPYKFTSPARRNVPDRIVLFPGKPAQFVELKAPGAKPREAQRREHVRITRAGGTVWIIDSAEGVDNFVQSMVAA